MALAPGRADQLHGREIGPVPGRIAGNEGKLVHRGMGADEKVREGGAARPAGAAVADKAFPGQKGRLPGQGQTEDQVRRQGLLQVLDARETDRNLRVDHGIDGQQIFFRVAGNGFRGPAAPFGGLRDHVEEYVRVNQGPMHDCLA